MWVTKKLWDERDRRYSELVTEREKALKIKETADERALKLASEIQAYKDEKANELRAQINSERGVYITRAEFEAANKPLVEFVLSSRAIADKRTIDYGQILAIMAIMVSIATAVILLTRK
ncbi:MAG: hypothetical protein WAL41_10760 [Mycobacterium sp.]